jgi:hypothetical protein
MSHEHEAHTFDRRQLLRDGGVVLGGVAGATLLAGGGPASARSASVASPNVPRTVVTTLTGAAIQQAIDALAATGGDIELVAGTYAIDAPIVVPSNVLIVGAGRSVTILRVDDGANAVAIVNSNVATGNSHITLRAMSLDGNKVAQGASGTVHGIEFHKCADTFIEDVEVHDCAGHGILVQGDGVVTRTGRFANVISHDNALCGIFASWAMREISYTAVTCDLNGQDGFYLDHSEAVVTGLQCNRNARDGLKINNVFTDNITGVTANLNGRYGIQVLGFTNSIGAAWQAHDNGQLQPGSDVYFTSAVGSYGLTDWAVVHGIECGAAQKSTWGGGWPNPPTATETYGLEIDPGVTGNVTIIGLRNSGGKLGSSKLAAVGKTGKLVLVEHVLGTADFRLARGNLVVGGGNLSHSAGGKVGFYGATAAAKPTVSGSKAGNAALTSLVHALATLGLVTDATS